MLRGRPRRYCPGPTVRGTPTLDGARPIARIGNTLRRRMHEHLDARILIAGEDPRVITVLRKILMREGYRAVETTGDLDRAPDLFRAYRPALTILGFTAPYHLGFTVMARLHELAAGDPLSILVMSPTRERMLHLRALEGGARDFLTTPVDRL